MKLIGLAGPKGVGKSSIAKEISRLGYLEEVNVTVMSFADPMRHMVIGLLQTVGMTAAEAVRLLRDPTQKEVPQAVLKGHTVRHVMQTLGTEWGRTCLSVDFWTWATMERVRHSEADVIVIDDVRFAEEATAIREAGGVIIELIRKGVDYTNEHVSEAGLAADLIDYVQPNMDGRIGVCAASIWTHTLKYRRKV